MSEIRNAAVDRLAQHQRAVGRHRRRDQGERLDVDVGRDLAALDRPLQEDAG